MDAQPDEPLPRSHTERRDRAKLPLGVPTMRATHPHFLLFSSARLSAGQASRWQFVLESIDGTRRLAAGDEEPDAPTERAELLAVVRGLEALDQPSRVTLVTPSRYVSRGIVRCLDDWRASHWRWERFGRLEPIRDHDLWQRVDRALGYHEIDCHTWPAEAASEPPARVATTDHDADEEVIASGHGDPAVLIVRNRAGRSRPAGVAQRLVSACDRWLGRCGEALSIGTRALLPLPRST